MLFASSKPPTTSCNFNNIHRDAGRYAEIHVISVIVTRLHQKSLPTPPLRGPLDGVHCPAGIQGIRGAGQGAC